ncbi:hypothetical protein GCM10023340_21130 [Nocardioides marinquilinus]|uniref:Secreted protein n=1 Tax=Nocardioides marinquilinus TaxID=1210400 RepID=A0ABP9PKF1_9ACTN
MKKILAATVAAATLGLTTVTVSPADAAPSKGCVTRAEYKKVKKGMTKARVHSIFGTSGQRVTMSGGVEGRGYKVCTSKTGAVGVAYSKGKLASKAVTWR